MTTADHVLVVGGTGPTGVPLVQGLVERGHRVTILHRGTHEDPETPTEVEHLHADPYDADSFRAALGDRRFDLVDRDVRTAARHRRGAGRSHRPVRVGRWRPGLPRVHEPVPDRTARAAGPDRRVGAARAGTGGRREGLPHRPHRGGRVRGPSRRHPLPLPVRLRAAPARAPRVVHRATGARRPRADRGGRRGPHAAPPRLHGELRARAAAGGRPSRRGRRADLQRRRRGGADDPPGRRPRGAPRWATASRSCRCPTSWPCRPDRS